MGGMKVLACLLKYDYGVPARGESGEKLVMAPAMETAGAEVATFWLEENGYPGDMDGLQAKIIREADRVKPDLIYFQLMRNEVRNETLDALKSKWLTVNLFCDDQWRFEDYSRFVAPHLGASITVDKFKVDGYRDLGCRVLRSQWGSPRYVRGLDPSKADYLYDVSFIGGRNATREWTVRALAKAGIQVACFGHGWPNGRVDIPKMEEIFYRSKINLNLSNSIPSLPSFRRFVFGDTLRAFLGMNARRYGSWAKSIRKALGNLYSMAFSKKRRESIKARNFEIPAAGGFQLSQFALEIDDYFVPGKEIALFATIDELIAQAKYYLKHEDERIAICRGGYARSEKYSYADRFKAVFEELGLA